MRFSGPALPSQVSPMAGFRPAPASALTAAVPSGSFTRLSILPLGPRGSKGHLKCPYFFTVSIAGKGETVNGGEGPRRDFNLKISIPVDKMERPCYNVYKFILRLQRPYVRNGNLPGIRVNKGKGTESPWEAFASGITVAVRVETAARWRKSVIGGT